MPLWLHQNVIQFTSSKSLALCPKREKLLYGIAHWLCAGALTEKTVVVRAMIGAANTSDNFSSGRKPPTTMVACRGHGWWRCSVGLFTMSFSSKWKKTKEKNKSGDLQMTLVKAMFITNKRSQFFTWGEAICGTLFQMICWKWKAYTHARETQDITKYTNQIKSRKTSENSHKWVAKMEETPCCPVLLLPWHLLMGSAGSRTLG